MVDCRVVLYRKEKEKRTRVHFFYFFSLSLPFRGYGAGYLSFWRMDPVGFRGSGWGRICSWIDCAPLGDNCRQMNCSGAGMISGGSMTGFRCGFAAAGGHGFAVNTRWTLGPGGEQIGEFAVSGASSTGTHSAGVPADRSTSVGWSNVFAAGKQLATYEWKPAYRRRFRQGPVELQLRQLEPVDWGAGACLAALV